MEGGQVLVGVGLGRVLLSAPWSLWLVLQLWSIVLFAVVIGQRHRERDAETLTLVLCLCAFAFAIFFGMVLPEHNMHQRGGLAVLRGGRNKVRDKGLP